MRELKTTRWMIAFVIAVCQLLVIGLLLLMEVYYHGNIFKIERDHLEIVEYSSCSTYPFDRASFLVIDLLFTLCMVQSYRARKLPANFKETKYIAVSVLFTEVFLLAYLVAGDNGPLSETLLMGSANVAMVSIMYGYKVVLVLFCPKLNNAGVLKRQLIELSHKNVDRTISLTSGN